MTAVDDGSRESVRTRAETVRLLSHFRCPISELGLRQRALLLAELSFIAYLPSSQCHTAAQRLGFQVTQFFGGQRGQAYVFNNQWDCVVSVCGNVVNGQNVQSWQDIEGELASDLVYANTVGRVHRGFQDRANQIWSSLEAALEDNLLPLWFTGHGIGGAVAVICAGRCQLSYIESEPQEVYSYGCPRIGNRRHVNYVPIPHFRWVYGNDVVSRTPPSWFGYRQSGREMWINRSAAVHEVGRWNRWIRRLQSSLSGIRSLWFDVFRDHQIENYIEALDRATKKERSQRPELTSSK